MKKEVEQLDAIFNGLPTWQELFDFVISVEKEHKIELIPDLDKTIFGMLIKEGKNDGFYVYEIFHKLVNVIGYNMSGFEFCQGYTIHPGKKHYCSENSEAKVLDSQQRVYKVKGIEYFILLKIMIMSNLNKVFTDEQHALYMDFKNDVNMYAILD